MAGGENTTFPGNGSLSDSELYDPSTGTFTETGALNVGRSFASSALLPDGDVLVTGGISNVPTALSSAELYDPATQSWSLTTPMNATGYQLTDTVLTNGDVLVTGFGASARFGESNPEVYDPTTATWTDTGALPNVDEDPTATLLGDGDVLAAGGPTTAAALYDPATNDWSATGLHGEGAARPDGDAARQRRGAGGGRREPRISSRLRPPRCTTRPRRRGRCPAAR